MTVDSRLAHLSSVQINDLINRYYKDEKIKTLIEEFKIDCKASELYKLFPPEEFEKIVCHNCKIPMIKNRVSKTSFIEAAIYCPECLHKFEDGNCKCESCNNFKKIIINNIYQYKPKKEIKDLTIKDKVYLATILRALELEEIDDRLLFLPVNNCEKSIAPTYKRTINILRYLSKRGIISVHHSSDINAFTGDLIEFDYGDSYYITMVKYTLNLDYRSELTNPNIEISLENINELYYIAREISLDECYEYLEYQMKKVNFEFNPGKITEEVFNELLDIFSIGQVYCVIYTAITQATRYYQENKVYKKQAVNSVITRCRAYAERAVANKWELKNYSRPYDCERSEISLLFFNRIIGLGDKYSELVYSYKDFAELLNLQDELAN